MKRRVLSDEELAQVVRLHQGGASWMRVQKETGIPRRIAKRAYGEWEDSQSVEELKEARKGIMLEELREHLDSLVHCAERLVNGLVVPESPNEERKAESIVSQIWQTDIDSKPDTRRMYRASPLKKQTQIRRHNMLLFQSLQHHTRNKIDWELLDQWEKAWDDCIAALEGLHQKTKELVNNYLNQDKGLTPNIENDTGKKDVTERVVEGLLWAAWWVVPSEVGEMDDSKTKFNVKQQNQVFKVVFAPTNRDLRLTFHKQQLAQAVANICNSAIKILHVENTLRPVADSLAAMKKAMIQLEDMLDPLRIRPMILRTRCDLCPA